MGKTRNTYRILVRKSFGKQRRWEENIKMDLYGDGLQGSEVDETDNGSCPMVGFSISSLSNSVLRTPFLLVCLYLKVK
jgi:hypothetical protein